MQMGTRDGAVVSEADSQMVIGPSGIAKLEPSGEIPAKTQKPHLPAKAGGGVSTL